MRYPECSFGETAIIVDGESLNRALKRNAHLDPYGCKSRFHLDYDALRIFLRKTPGFSGAGVNYYFCLEPEIKKLEASKETPRLEGRVVSFSKNYGFIRGEDERDYFVYHVDIEGTGFKLLTPGEQVSFISQKTEKGFKALSVRHRGLSQNQHREKKLDFISDLEQKGYSIHISRNRDSKNATKMVLATICLDLVAAIHSCSTGSVLLVTDDPDYAEVVRGVKNRYGLFVAVACFSDRLLKTKKLLSVCDQAVFFDEHVDSLVSDHKFLNSQLVPRKGPVDTYR